MENNKFAIKLGDAVPSDSFTPPDDPLNELSELEMGLWRYCHDCNRTFWFEINDTPLELEGRPCVLTFDPDLSFLLRDLPKQIVSFVHGDPLKLIFGERCLSVEFMPIGSQVSFAATTFGSHVATAKLMLNKEECESQLQRFIAEIASAAVMSGFLAAEIADAFLAKGDNRILVVHENGDWKS